MTRRASLWCAGALAMGPAAHGQSNPTFLIEASNPVSPSSPTTVLSVYAAWDQPAPGDYIYSGADLDAVAGDGHFTKVRHFFKCGVAGCSGTIRGNRVDGLAIGQVHIPQLGIFGNPDNPIHLVDLTWTTTDFTPRTVGVHTENTTRFIVTPIDGGPTINLMATFTPGSGEIVVTPAPAALTVLGIGAMIGARRRRAHSGAMQVGAIG